MFSTYLSVDHQDYLLKRFAAAGNIELRKNLSDDELLDLYRTSDLLVLPLLDATANVALLESLSCGLPPVITDVGGDRDYVDETCSVLTSPQDARAMSETIIDLLRDEVRMRQLSLAARKRALTFDWRRIAEQMQHIYKQL